MSSKSDITTEEEEVQKASPRIPHLKHEQAKVEHNTNIEMTPLPATNESRGRVQLLALSCLQIVLYRLCMPSEADVHVHATLEYCMTNVFPSLCRVCISAISAGAQILLLRAREGHA